jgi:hypothetical protein
LPVQGLVANWGGGTTQALFDFMESEGMEDASAVLGVLGLPPDDVQLARMHGGWDRCVTDRDGSGHPRRQR